MSADPKKDEQRFWSWVIPEPMSGCWLWTGAVINSGYGTFGIGSRSNGTKRNILTHRYALETKLAQAIPDGMCALHKCDVKLCVNPDHLYLGTYAENTNDALVRGKMVFTPNKGEANGRAKLTPGDVRNIRASRQGRTQLAKKYGVTPSLISSIIYRRTWGHV